MPNPLVIIHGYSDHGASFEAWKTHLTGQPVPGEIINICEWVSLSNEITIKDIAEGMDRALRFHRIDGDFDAFVHSTGMLVIRAWLAGNPNRPGRLKRLIAIAPATFGSPLASLGRSVIGSLFGASSKDVLSPDFLSAGNLILDALEPGSKFTWDLAHVDMLGEKPFYGVGGDTPYVFVFDGTSAYEGLRKFANHPGTDGTVRWAACSLDTEKFTIDFRNVHDVRFMATNTAEKGGMSIPFWPVPGVNHGTIASNPPDILVNAVRAALTVDSEESLEKWRANHTAAFQAERARLEASNQLWQQFVIHARDQLGDPIHDFHVRVTALTEDGEEAAAWDEGNFELHPYAADKSYRCYHVNISESLKFLRGERVRGLRMQVMASSGSAWVGYHGEGNGTLTNAEHRWDSVIDVPVGIDEGPCFFYPFTTTLVEVILERDALDFGSEQGKIFTFLAK